MKGNGSHSHRIQVNNLVLDEYDRVGDIKIVKKMVTNEHL